MITLETVLGGLVALAGLIAAVFGLGHVRGRSAAERQRAVETAEIARESADKRLEVIKNAENARQGAGALSDSAVDQRLREQWTRASGD